MEPTQGGKPEEKKPDGTAGLILIVLIILLVAAASWPALSPSGSAGADPLSIFLNIGSSEGEEPEGGGGLRLSIITEFFNDLFGGSSDGTARLVSSGGTPGQVRTLPPEFTATPSPGGSATATPTGTLTVVALGTAGPSPTASATRTTGPSTGTDSKDPQISGGSMSPGSGSSISCTTNVQVDGLRVYDPDFSSGMDDVQLKYQFIGSARGYQYGPQLTKISGGFTGPGTTWDAVYQGGIKIDFAAGWAATGLKVFAVPLLSSSSDTATPIATTLSPAPSNTSTPVPASSTPAASNTPDPTPTWTASPTPGTTATSVAGPFTVEVYAYVEDNAGNSSFLWLATYTIPGPCP